jgi:hypothetical protein
MAGKVTRLFVRFTPKVEELQVRIYISVFRTCVFLEVEALVWALVVGIFNVFRLVLSCKTFGGAGPSSNSCPASVISILQTLVQSSAPPDGPIAPLTAPEAPDMRP